MSEQTARQATQQEIAKSQALEAQFDQAAPTVSAGELPLIPELMEDLKGFADLAAAEVAPLELRKGFERGDGSRLSHRFFLPNENVKTDDAYPSNSLAIWSPEGKPDTILVQYPHKKTAEEDKLYDDPYGNGGPTQFETHLESTPDGVSIKTMLWGSEDFPGRHVYGVWINDPEDCKRLKEFLKEAPGKLYTEEPLSEEESQVQAAFVRELIQAMENSDVMKQLRGSRKQNRVTALLKRLPRR